jgi:hypothetical protein
MPRTSPRACLTAVPSAIALSFSYHQWEDVRNDASMTEKMNAHLRGMVVVDPEVALHLHLQRPAGMLCERRVHLLSPLSAPECTPA